jgi:hypothetical protein
MVLQKHTTYDDDGRIGKTRHNAQQTDGVHVMYMLPSKTKRRHETLYNTNPLLELSGTVLYESYKMRLYSRLDSVNYRKRGYFQTRRLGFIPVSIDPNRNRVVGIHRFIIKVISISIMNKPTYSYYLVKERVLAFYSPSSSSYQQCQ